MSLGIRITTFVGFLFCASCALPSSGGGNSTRGEDRKNVRDQLSGEMSLKADRDELAAMRKEIPAEKQKSNDELALSLNMMKQGTERPEMVRDKFTVLVEKKRSSFRDKVQKLRESYRKSETKRRDEYLDTQKAKRTAWASASKRKPDELREFFAEQDRDRQSFFSDERDRRANFESEINAQSKDFDSYMHEKMNEFNEQYRIYSKKFSEKPKEKKAVTGDDFRKMNETSAQPLGTED